MNQDSSLLSRIKSKYILQKILSLAFGEIKPVFKLFKYNKVLLNKIHINFENIKDNHKYTIQKKVHKEQSILVVSAIDIAFLLILFIIYLVYIILFYVSGKFKEGIMRKGYNKNRKKYVDIMDKYFLWIYFGFIILTFILNILLFFDDKYVLKGFTKFKYFLFIFLFDFIHYILYIIKFAFSAGFIREDILNLLLSQKYYLIHEEEQIWFYIVDTFIIAFLSFLIISELAGFLVIGCDFKKRDDELINILNHITGIKIVDYELPESFSNLSKKERIKLLFSKSYMRKYRYKLNKDQFTLIEKMNNIRKKYNIPSLDYNGEEKLPEFVINGKTEIALYENENIYKLSLNLYIFKYPKNEFQNQFNNSEVLNIITNDLLKEVNIIERNNFEYISIYNNNSSNNNINLPQISIDGNKQNINTVNSEDFFLNRSVTEIK